MYVLSGQHVYSNGPLKRGQAPSARRLRKRPVPGTRRTIAARISFLYTNIGRGHPHYLDGIIEALIRSQAIGLVRRELDVFELSKGVSQVGWRSARWLYRHGSSGPFSALYAHLRARSDFNRGSVMLGLMGRQIRAAFIDDPEPLMVAHPTLVGILKGKRELIYQHGELVTPAQAAAIGATTVLVPTPEAARPFVDAGYHRKQIVVTGLCVEPTLVKQAADAYVARSGRYGEAVPLTGAFFSSGAEPPVHVFKLISAALSALHDGGRVVLFGQRGGRLASRAALAFARRSVSFAFVDSLSPLPAELPPATIVTHSSRREESLLTARLFASFDYFVAPSHERTNWAVGLGLPMFIIGPDIGPFAPLNRALLYEAGVADALDASMDAHLFGTRLRRLRSAEELADMARAGWGKREINGFGRIAAFLVSKYAGGAL